MSTVFFQLCVFVVLCGLSGSIAGCPDGLFSCGFGGCISPDWVCDRYPDCPSGSADEDWCTVSQAYGSSQPCPDGMFACNNTYQCITDKWKCDNIDDCGDGSDERTELCHNPCDLPSMFRCFQGLVKDGSEECVPTQWMCDDVEDCEDGSDEYYCY